jgi:hypothetical protein
MPDRDCPAHIRLQTALELAGQRLTSLGGKVSGLAATASNGALERLLEQHVLGEVRSTVQRLTADLVAHEGADRRTP